MPVVIDEVVISVEVGQEASPSTQSPRGAEVELPAQARQELVEECVERVMEILRRREEP